MDNGLEIDFYYNIRLQSTQEVKEESIADWLQYILNYSELVEDLSWAIGPDESLVYYICKKNVGRWHLVIA